MIPLRDHNPSSTFPFITYALLAINVAIFIFMLGMNSTQLDQFIYTWAVIPETISNQGFNLSIITAMFLHGSIGHIIGNMLFLHIFGDNLEDRLGHLKYLIFYLATGIIATYAQVFTDPTSDIPNLGASGAIAGLMGGYLTLFPNHRIDILVPFGPLLHTASVPAFTMLIYWVIAQFFGSFGQLAAPGTGGVAYLAHLGGFIAGLILIRIFPKR